MQPTVVVDSREWESRLLAALHSLGVETVIRRLPVADYAAGEALVERKSIRDLHRSIISGRFWPQIGRLSPNARRPYLIVEGRDLDAGPLRPESVRGALLAVSELGVGVIRTDSPADSAMWLRLLAHRASKPRGRRVHAKPSGSRAGEEMLAAVPGISNVTARSLLERFGSVAAVLAASEESLLSIAGVGPKRASALHETLHRSHRPS
jgi:ERCC4-type nuclease